MAESVLLGGLGGVLGPASTASRSQTEVYAEATCSRPANTEGVSHFPK